MTELSSLNLFIQNDQEFKKFVYGYTSLPGPFNRAKLEVQLSKKLAKASASN
jgi:hypothetical protein